MHDPTIEALDISRSEFARRLDAIETTDWARPTPCEEWRVPLPAPDLLAFRNFEIVVHTWDVSRAIGFDEHFDERSAVLVTPMFEQLIKDLPQTAGFAAHPARAIRLGAAEGLVTGTARRRWLRVPL